MPIAPVQMVGPCEVADAVSQSPRIQCAIPRIAGEGRQSDGEPGGKFHAEGVMAGTAAPPVGVATGGAAVPERERTGGSGGAGDVAGDPAARLADERHLGLRPRRHQVG